MLILGEKWAEQHQDTDIWAKLSTSFVWSQELSLEAKHNTLPNIKAVQQLRCTSGLFSSFIILMLILNLDQFIVSPLNSYKL